MPADVPTRGPEAAVPASADPAPDLDRALSAKRKDPPPTTGTRFKAAANLVVAMRRFQCECVVCVWERERRSEEGPATAALRAALLPNGCLSALRAVAHTRPAPVA